MELHQLPVVAGSVSTALFVGSYLPMLVKAVRSKDLSSYSRSSLVLANVGNAIQTMYVVTLPLGPIWGLHSFYVVSTAMMLLLHLRHERTRPAAVPPHDGCRRTSEAERGHADPTGEQTTPRGVPHQELAQQVVDAAFETEVVHGRRQSSSTWLSQQASSTSDGRAVGGAAEPDLLSPVADHLACHA